MIAELEFEPEPGIPLEEPLAIAPVTAAEAGQTVV